MLLRDPGDVGRALVVAHLPVDVVVIGLGLGLRVLADDVAAGEDPDLAPELVPGELLDLGDLLRRRLEGRQASEDQVAVLRREAAPGRARARVHDHRIRLLDRLGLEHAAGDVEVLPLEVVRSVDGPELLQHLRPLVGDLVALVVLTLGQPEHRELRRVPAGDDVQPEAAAGDMVGGRAHLRGEHRVREGNVQASRPAAQVKVSNERSPRFARPP